MFTDDTRRSVQDEIRQHDLRAYQRFWTHDVIQAAATRAGVKIADSPLHLGNLVWLGIAGAMHTARSFADILAMTLKIICNAENYADSLLGRMEQKVLATDNEPGRNPTPGLYHRRWEIETTFRELKVEQGMEGHLRGRTPEAILEWERELAVEADQGRFERDFRRVDRLSCGGFFLLRQRPQLLQERGETAVGPQVGTLRLFEFWQVGGQGEIGQCRRLDRINFGEQRHSGELGTESITRPVRCSCGVAASRRGDDSRG